MKGPNDKSYEHLKRARHFSVGMHTIEFYREGGDKTSLKESIGKFNKQTSKKKLVSVVNRIKTSPKRPYPNFPVNKLNVYADSTVLLSFAYRCNCLPPHQPSQVEIVDTESRLG